MRSCWQPVERCRPALGTTLAIRVRGLPEAHAHAAIDAAFAAVAHVQARMSFQNRDSDVSRLNRAVAGRDVEVDPDTYAVLVLAHRIACASDGVFDPTVAGDLVSSGGLAGPGGARRPDPEARWTDVMLEGAGLVRLRRPVWLDLSGIAKGYAVDQAIAALIAAGARHGCVDAGGDLRTIGRRQTVALWTGYPDDAVAVVRIADGSLASSGGRPDGSHAAERQHRNGLTREPVAEGRFACVLAPSCAVADALTKVVLALGPGSAATLTRFGAAAHLREADGAWLALAGAAA